MRLWSCFSGRPRISLTHADGGNSFITSPVARKRPDVLIQPHRTSCPGHRRNPALLCFFTQGDRASDESAPKPASSDFMLPRDRENGSQRQHKMPELRAASCLLLHYLLPKKSLQSCCSPFSPQIKLDEILTFKLQRSLFLFCSRGFEMHWTVSNCLLGSLTTPPAFLWVFSNQGTCCHAVSPPNGISVIAEAPGSCLSKYPHESNNPGTSA